MATNLYIQWLDGLVEFINATGILPEDPATPGAVPAERQYTAGWKLKDYSILRCTVMIPEENAILSELITRESMEETASAIVAVQQMVTSTKRSTLQSERIQAEFKNVAECDAVASIALDLKARLERAIITFGDGCETQINRTEISILGYMEHLDQDNVFTAILRVEAKWRRDTGSET